MSYLVRRLLLVVLAVVCLGTAAMASEIDALCVDLAGQNEAARSNARQMLPRFGADAVDKLLPLLGHDDIAVRRVAYNVLGDIANRAAGPGRAAERTRVASAILAALTPDASETVKLQLLRLASIVVPEGMDVSPIAALLKDADLRMKARNALQSIGTAEACRAVLAEIPNTDTGFACALLDSAGKMQRPESIGPVLTLTQHDAATVRASAALALAWTGEPALVKPFQTVCERADAVTRFDAVDALLRLADAMMDNGGNWQRAIGTYIRVLESERDPVLASTALMGLGRHGDETVVPVIVAAVKRGDPDVGATAVMAFEALRGPACVRAVAQAYALMPESVQLQMIGLFGRRGAPEFMPHISAALASDEADYRRAALSALGQATTIDALPALVQVAETGSEEERALALQAAMRLAGSMVSAGKEADAGRAYLKLFELASDDAVRVKALQGLAQYPVAEAYDAAKAALDTPALEQAALNVLPQLFGPLARAGQEDKARAVFDDTLRRDSSPQRLAALAGQLQGANTKLDTTALLGVVKTWRLIGPFEWANDADWARSHVGESDVDVTAPAKDGDDTRQWKTVTTGDALGMVNLMGEIGAFDRVFAYAYTEFEVAEAMPAQVRLGSDDGNTVWLNGEKVWDNPVDRGAALDQDIADVQLKAGVNKLLVRISQGAGGWNFCLRVTKPDGTAVPFAVRK
ncbi:MAG: HEAT repeat domain-containing protein [bacterium]|nr:HEAT repeat domain-containing protein [bacterium]